MTHSLDFCGIETTLPPGSALSAWNATQRGFLAHAAATPDRLAETLEAAPDFALGHAARGLFCLLLGRRETRDAAGGALVSARAAAARVLPSAREAAYVEALALWLDGRPGATVARLEHVLLAHPEDALAMKLVQAILFMLGRAGEMRRSVERLMPAWGADHPALGYLYGCHAFTLEETGEYAAALDAGQRALAMAPDDAWGLHAVAHVHDMRGRAADGLNWLAGRETAWAHCNNFRYHVWWHKALMHLDLGNVDAALELYDAEIRADHTDDYRDIANAASLLMRLEIDGVSVGRRWEELADLAERRTGDGCLAFADLHYMLALIGGRREGALGRMLSRIAHDARRDATEADAVYRQPGLSAAEGLVAYCEGDHARAFARLNAAGRDLGAIGGSHAQRDVFTRVTIEAALRAGQIENALGLLEARARARGAEDGYTRRRREVIAETRAAGTAPDEAA